MAERIITVKLDVDATEFSKGADVVEKDLGTINQQLVKMEDELRNLSKETSQEVAKKSFDKLNESVEKNVLSIQDLGVAADNYKNIAIAAGTTTPLGQEALAKAAEMEQRLDGVNREVAQLAEGGRALNTAMQLGTGVLAGWSAFQGISALVGTENEKLQETFIKLQAAQAALIGVKELSIAVQKQGILATTAQAVATSSLTVAQTAYNVVVGTSTGLMKAFRIALASTGIGLLVVGLASLIANFDKVSNAISNAIDWFAGLGEYVVRAIEWYNELGVVGKAVAAALAAPVVAAIEVYQWFFGEVEKGTADMMAAEKRLAEQRRQTHEELKKQRREEINLLKENRREEEYLFNRRQKGYDLDIERLEAVGKSSNALKLKKLEDIKDELEAQRQFIVKSRKAWEDYYEGLRISRGESKEEFIANLKEQGIDLEAQANKQRKQLNDLSNAIYSSESKILAFKRQVREKNAAEYKARKDEELRIEQEKNKSQTDLLNELEADFDKREEERKAKILKAAEWEKEQMDKLATDLFNQQQKVANDLAEWERQQQVDEFQIQMDELKRKFDSEIALFTNNEEMKMRIKAQFDEQIRLIEEEARIADEEAEAIQMQERLDRINSVVDQAQTALDTLNSINSIMDEIGDRRKEKIASDAQQEIEILQKAASKRLSNEKLTAKQTAKIEYELAMAEYRINKEAAKKEDEIAERQFKREKALALVTIAVNTAKGVSQALGSSPPPASFIMAGITAALGIAQAAVVATKKFSPTADSISPPTFTQPSFNTNVDSGDSGGSSSDTGNLQNDTTTNTDSLINNPPPVIISQVEINRVQGQMATIEEVSVL